MDSMFAPRQGAVSLTFDDGDPSVLEHAIPVLDALGLLGTFYLPTRDDWRERLAPWKDVASRGHEIGNHTRSHPAPANMFPGYAHCYDFMTLEDIEQDIRVAQEALEELCPAQKEWTFCYPCYTSDVGRGMGKQSYVPIVARDFVAGRGAIETGFSNHPEQVDLAVVGGTSFQDMNAAQMIETVESLTTGGRWLVPVFHTIGGDYISVQKDDFVALCEYLASRRDEIWCAPLIEVARDIRSRRAGQ